MSDNAPETVIVVIESDDDDDDDDDIPIIDAGSIQPLKLPDSLLKDENFQQLTARLANVAAAGNTTTINSSIGPTVQEQETDSTIEGTTLNSKNVATSEENFSSTLLEKNCDDDCITSKVPATLPLDALQDNQNALNESHCEDGDTDLLTTLTQPLREETNNCDEIMDYNDQKRQLEIDEDEMFKKYSKRIKLAEQNEIKDQNIIVIEIDDDDEEETLSVSANNEQEISGTNSNNVGHDEDSYFNLESEWLQERELFKKYEKRIRAVFRVDKSRRKRERAFNVRELQMEEEDLLQRYSDRIHLAEIQETNEINAGIKIANENEVTNDDEFTIDEYIQDEDVLFTRYEDVIVSAERCLRKEQKLIDKMKEVLQVRKDRRSLLIGADDSSTAKSKNSSKK
jgi:hypothetical protein